jgi:hypothetical protein
MKPEQINKRRIKVTDITNIVKWTSMRQIKFQHPKYNRNIVETFKKKTIKFEREDN